MFAGSWNDGPLSFTLPCCPCRDQFSSPSKHQKLGLRNTSFVIPSSNFFMCWHIFLVVCMCAYFVGGRGFVTLLPPALIFPVLTVCVCVHVYVYTASLRMLVLLSQSSKQALIHAQAIVYQEKNVARIPIIIIILPPPPPPPYHYVLGKYIHS